MLFKGLLWLWRNGFEFPLSKCGASGRAVGAMLYPVFIYLPGVALTLLGYLLYPPVITVQKPARKASGG
jgi:hypothetical protein